MTKVLSGIKVSAPATISNLNCGTDILAMALKEPCDEVIIYKSDKPGLNIKSISGDKKLLSKIIDENIAGLTALSVWNHLIENNNIDHNIGIELEIRKKITANLGLGSNEALAVAGAMAVNEFFGGPLTKRELLPLIKTANCSIYGKVSLAALSASLLGSCMLVRGEENIDIQRVSIPRGLYFAILVPNIQTEGIYPELVSVQNSIKQSANLSAFILGLNNTDFELIGRSMQDFIIEPHFSNSIPFYKEMKAASIDLGALGFGLSGTGSVVYAFCNNSVKAEACLELMKEFYVNNKIRCGAWISAVNMEGAGLE